MLLTLGEQLIKLQEAAGILPRRRRGRKPHVSCLYRWTTTGCRGVLLESVQVGGTRCTSIEALNRFFQRLSESRNATQQMAPTSSDARTSAIKKAEAEFDR